MMRCFRLYHVGKYDQFENLDTARCAFNSTAKRGKKMPYFFIFSTLKVCLSLGGFVAVLVFVSIIYSDRNPLGKELL